MWPWVFSSPTTSTPSELHSSLGSSTFAIRFGLLYNALSFTSSKTKNTTSEEIAKCFDGEVFVGGAAATEHARELEEKLAVGKVQILEVENA